MPSKILVLIIMLMPFGITAQYDFMFETDLTVPVSKSGQSQIHAWVGGLNNPQFNEADLNSDDIIDLVIYDRSDGRVLTFLNNGTEGEVDYVYAPEYAANFPSDLESYVRLYDYNCDGAADLFTSFEFAVKVYNGVYLEGTNALGFELATEKLTYGSEENFIAIASPDYPYFGDINNDDRLDILTFSESVGGFVEWYKNVANNCDDFIFVLEDECWGNFFEDGISTSVHLDYETCGADKGPVPTNTNNNDWVRHPGSTILAVDLTNDGIKEIVVGDINFNDLVMLTNGGTLEDAFIVEQDTTFPKYDTWVDVLSFPVSFAMDVNNDGTKDFLAAPNSPTAADHYECSWMYEGTADDEGLTFSFNTKRFLSEDMIEFGRNAYPAEVDYDGDGLMDLVIGNYGNISFSEGSNTNVASLVLYRNVGTETEPVYEHITNDWLSLSQLNLFGLHPTFGDLTGDGAIDMICGLTGNNNPSGQDYNGSLLFFNNLAEAGEGISFGFPTFLWKGIDVGQVAAPQIVDVNEDGKNDLIIGERNGKVFYYENNGTETEPEFELISDFWGNVDVKDESGKGFSRPHLFKNTFGDFGDDNWILMVGSNDGRLLMYYIQDNDIYNADAFSTDYAAAHLPDFRQGLELSPFITSYNKLLLGNRRGGLMAYNITASFFDSAPLLSQQNFTIYPNPANDVLFINTDLSIETLSVLDVSGRLITTQNEVNQLDISDLPTGVYFAKITSNGQSITKKFVKR